MYLSTLAEIIYNFWYLTELGAIMLHYPIVTKLSYINLIASKFFIETICVFFFYLILLKNIVEMSPICLFKHFVKGLTQMLDFNKLAFKDKRWELEFYYTTVIAVCFRQPLTTACVDIGHKYSWFHNLDCKCYNYML